MTDAVKVMREINHALGDDVIFLGSDESLEIERIPTGVLPMDDMLEGGVARGRWTECFGNYSTLKSFIGYSTIASAQALGLKVGLVDTEHAFDPRWAEHIGVDLSRLHMTRPVTAELAVDTTEAMIRDGFGLVVWDSVAAMAPQDEVRKREHDESHQPARLAALMSRAARKLTSANSQTALLYINQTRMNIGMTFGSNRTTPGGRALPFYASMRIELQRGQREYAERHRFKAGKLVKAKVAVASQVIAKIEKSKLNKPVGEVYFTFDHTTGYVDDLGYLIGKGIEHGLIIQPSKGWWTIKGEKTKARMAKLRERVEDDQGLCDRLRELTNA
jgi:recombination protein RecA